MTFVIRPKNHNGLERYLVSPRLDPHGKCFLRSIFPNTFISMYLNPIIDLSALAGYLTYHNPDAGCAGLFDALRLQLRQKMTPTPTGCTMPKSDGVVHGTFLQCTRSADRYNAPHARHLRLNRQGDCRAMSQICVTTKSIFSVLIPLDFFGRVGVDPLITSITSIVSRAR